MGARDIEQVGRLLRGQLCLYGHDRHGVTVGHVSQDPEQQIDDSGGQRYAVVAPLRMQLDLVSSSHVAQQASRFTRHQAYRTAVRPSPGVMIPEGHGCP